MKIELFCGHVIIFMAIKLVKMKNNFLNNEIIIEDQKSILYPFIYSIPIIQLHGNQEGI